MNTTATETTGKFLIGDIEYPIDFFNYTADKENYFCGEIELNFSGDEEPDVVPGESYVARLKIKQGNKEGEWYFPWLWFKKEEGDHVKAETHGAIYCPKGLSAEDEEKYDAMNLIIASEVYMAMTEEVWKNLLLVFGDWLQVRGIPQAEEFKTMAADVEVPEDPLLEYTPDEDDEDESLGSFSGSGEEEEDGDDDKEEAK